MELFFTVMLIVALSLIWYFVIMKVAKYTVGKNANTWQIIAFLLVAGPVGWIILLIIAVTDAINNITDQQK